MHHINVEDRIYKLTDKQYKKFMKMVDETFDTPDWQDSLQWVEDNGKYMFIVDSYNY